MQNKYYNAISKIQVDKDFKEKLILDLENNIEENKINYMKKEGVFMKLKRIIIAIISILMMLVGSGVVYASLGGTINGVPVLEWMGIKFSNNYSEYIEPIENQVIENDDVKVTLESTVCDDGFTILQFRVNISEEKINSYKTEEDIETGWEVPFCYLSFNDPVIDENGYKYTELNGSNYNIIIDGEEKWVRGHSAQSMEKVSENEYIVYQMWFLDEHAVNNKNEFEITLNDVSIGLGEDCIPVDGSFNVKVSKEKALNNTKTIIPKNDTTLKYKSVEKSIEKITITPLQTIIKIKNVYKDVNLEDLTYVLDKDYVGMMEYAALDQDNNVISSYATETETRITYSDGTVEEFIPGEGEFSRDEFEHATYETVEMIAVEQNDNINEIILKVYENADYNDTIINIMEYQIKLNTNKIKAENKDVIIYDKNDPNITDEYKIYYKGVYGVEYSDFEDYFEESIDIIEDYDIDTEVNLIEDAELSYNFQIDSKVEYIEIEVEDKESINGIKYKAPLKIKDTSVIEELKNIINDNNEYKDFEKDFGAGGYFEGAPSLIIYMKDGRKLWIMACDNLLQDEEGTFINIMNVHEIDEEDYEVDSKIYIVNSELESFLEKTYNKYEQ